MLRSLRARRVAKLPGAVRRRGRVLSLAEDPQLVRDQVDGKDLDGRPGIKLRDAISTDEITPAYICYYYDDTLGDFPYLGLKCGEEFPVTRGSVKRGGFTASVSGKRRGKGSSREQSPYAEMCAGIKLVVAENIERIYRENCQNLGVLTTTDFSILDRVRRGEAIPVEDREGGGRENDQVLAVLAADALEGLGHHQLDAGAHLGVRGLLARRALATPLAADRGDEAAALHRPPRDRELVAALQAQVGEVAEGFVVVVADVGGGDLVGRDIVAQLAGRCPVHVLPGELGANEGGVFGQKQDASLEPDEIGESLDPAGLQRVQHERKLHRLLGAEQDEPGGKTMLFTGCRLTVTILLVAWVTPLWGQRPAAAPRSLPPVNSAAVDAHIRYLADDLLEGRAPGTRGGRLAAQYIAAQFEALELEPAGPDSSYFQPVALVGLTPHPSLVWGASGAAQSLKYLDDFVAWAERPEPEIRGDGEVVFVGYGIRAPEWRWDDYKDADLRGKVGLMLVNDPGLQDSTVFNGRALTYYGRWTYQLDETSRRGALGVLLIHTTESATYPWEVVRGSWSVEQFLLDRPAAQSLAFAGWVTTAAVQAG